MPRKLRSVVLASALTGFAFAVAARPAAAQCVSLTTLGAASSQNFDTLANTGTTNNLTITGWFLTETGGGARDNEQYAADNGTSGTGDTYSYGATAATERALGGLQSGTLIPVIGACFTNNTGATVTSLSIAYTGEQWRLGTSGRTDRIDFQFSTNATDLVGGTWTDVNALDFSGPISVGTVGALDGNLAANRTAIGSTIPSLSIANGATVWIRWNSLDVSGADDGLAVDDFSLTPIATPNLTVNDVSLNEGNAGTTSFTFTVSLSAPAGAGGVTFDIATADGTAQDDNPVAEDNDYVAKSLAAQTIPAGSSTYSFTVLVNGDTAPETNETFFVNVTNLTGANLLDGQGQGTIVNDDAAPNLTVNDITLAEGNAGTTMFTFTVSLSAPAGPGGVTFDIATADGTAQDDNPATEDDDYVAKSLTAQTIPAGSSTYSFTVLVNGDLVPEGDETFFVNVTNVTNAILLDGQGLGTITNDDLFKIHDIQGNGATTPIPPATPVTIEGVVVASFQGMDKLQGFFLEEEDADFDADPATSEGVFVFCNSCPTPVAEGQRVRATGPVSEFFGMTEVTASTAGSVVVTDAANHLAEVTPAPLDLPVVGDINTFYEAREGMVVTFVDPLSVSEYFELPRFGTIELFEGGRPVQFTETSPPSMAGLAAHLDNLNRRRVILDDDDDQQNVPLTLPDGSQFVFHPRANGGFSVGTQGVDFFRGGDLVNGLRGVLHWSFAGVSGTDAWRIRPAAASPATFTVANPRPATPPSVGGAIKAASVNLLNYFTTIDTTASTSSGPCAPAMDQDCRGADSVAELSRQRERASIVLCTLNADVFGFMELENTTPSATITDLLGAVNARCGGAHPYAFVNTGGTLGTDAIRVELVYRTGILSPVGSPLVDLDPIHNRPPTAQTFDVVDAANPAFGERFTVIANHFKSKGCDAAATGADADAMDGQSCYAGRRTAQASRLLSWISGTVLPAAGDPDVLLLGDFNSYAKETPVTTLTAGGFVDVETALLGPAAYSYLFDAELGHLDYAFASSSLFGKVTGVGAWHINADEVPLFDYNDEVKDTGEAAFEEKPDGSALVPPRVVFQPATPYRASDHDPVLTGLFQVADLSVTKVDTPDPVTAGTNLTYTITVTNSGPDPAASASWSDTLPTGTTFVSLPAVAGWSCTMPAVGAGGTVSCSNPSFAVGSAVFTLTVAVAPSVTGTLSNTATVSSPTGDPTPGDRSATATTTVVASADLAVTKVDTPDPVTAGTNLTYTITVANAGPSNAAGVSLGDTLPAGTTFVSLASPGGWSCTTPAVGAGGTVSCSLSSLAPGSAVFTLVVNVGASVASGTVLSNTAAATTATTDPNPGNGSATATTTVAASADLAVTKVDTPDPVTAGTNLTYTITVANAGPSNAAGVSLGDTLPAGTMFVSLASPGGWSCTTPAVGAGGTVSCSLASFAPGSAVFTLVVNVGASVATGSVISNTASASASTSDPNPGNGSATATTTVGAGSADLSVTKVDTPDPVTAGSNLTYTITVTNAGPSNATTASLSDTLPSGTTFVSLASPGGWSCTMPAVGAGGTVSCSNPSLGVGSAVFTLTVNVGASVAAGTVLSNTATATSATTDPSPGNNSATATTTVAAAAGLTLGMTDAPDPVNAGSDLTYTITVTNAGPSNAASAAVSDTLPAGTTFVSLAAPAGWSCTSPAVGAGGTVDCTISSVGVGSAVFTLVVHVGPSFAPNSTIGNTAQLSSATDPPAAAQTVTATTTTTVLAPAAVTATKTVTGDFSAGGTVTYSIVLHNAGPADQADNPGAELTDVLPAELTLLSATATSGTATATPATNTVTWNGVIPAGGSVTITIQAEVESGIPIGTQIVNQGTAAFDADGNGTNESTASTDDPAAPGASDPTTFAVAANGVLEIPTLDGLGLALLAALLALGGAALLRRRVVR